MVNETIADIVIEDDYTYDPLIDGIDWNGMEIYEDDV